MKEEPGTQAVVGHPSGGARPLAVKLPHSSKGRAKGGFDLYTVSDPGWQLSQDRWAGIPLIQEHYAGKILLVPDGPAYRLVDSLHTQILHQSLPWWGLTWDSGLGRAEEMIYQYLLASFLVF